MIVIDSSAIVAYLLSEASGPRILDAIEQSPLRHMSAVSVYETRIVLGSRRGDSALGGFEMLLGRTQMIIQPFEANQAYLAHRAYERFGKGSGHPAQLNMGDCAAYALAKSMELPLLYVGEDFGRTDITSAL